MKLDLPPGYDGYVPFNYSLKATASSKFGPLLNAAESIGVSDIIPRGTSQTKSKVGVIVGTVVGGILVVIGVLLMVIWYMRRKRRAAAKYGALHRPMRVPPPRHRSGINSLLVVMDVFYLLPSSQNIDCSFEGRPQYDLVEEIRI